MSASRANVVVGIGVAGAVVAGAVVVSQGGEDGDGGATTGVIDPTTGPVDPTDPTTGPIDPTDPPGPVATFTFPSSDAIPVDAFHLRRGLIGGTLARASFAVTQGGTCIAASIAHGSSRANPVTFDSDFAGCTHAFATLAAGDQTCAAVATAAAAALTTAGASGVAAVGCDVTVAEATSIIIGRPRSMVRGDQGKWGMQRDLAFASGATTNGAMGATGGVHLNPRCNGRILAACLRADGGNDVRIGIGEGPDYAADPTAITILAEGVATAVDNNQIGCFIPTDPVPVLTTDDTWIVFRGPAGELLRFREHAGTPIGNGNLVLNESLIWSGLTGDPTTPLGASVDLGGGGGPFALYAHVFYVDECSSSGQYPGDGALDEWIGWQATTVVGADFTDPSDMQDEIVTFRYPPLPWSNIQFTQIRQGVGARTAGDDFGVAVYSWDAADVPNIPSLSVAPLLANLGPFGVTTASAFNTHTLASPLNVSDTTLAGDSIGVLWNCGRAGGAQATTLQFVIDEDGFAGTQCSLTHWSSGALWSDFCDDQGYGVRTEYQSRESNGSLMAFSDPTLPQPNPYAIDTTPVPDLAPLNAPRQAIRIVRTGITGVVE